MKIYKYHALGNDYIVVREADLEKPLTSKEIIRICHRHFGVGSDGILFDGGPDSGGVFSLRIFNPDGGEAEKSGNGLRIYSRFLWDHGKVRDEVFQVRTEGGVVNCHVKDQGREVTVEMGEVSFQSDRIPVLGESREVIEEELEAAGELLTYSAATIGNPHCVVRQETLNLDELMRLGAALENHSNFPNRTNVQFMEVLDRSTIKIEIWERGAGYTLASGSSASATAAVAVRLGLCDSPILVQMQGGALHIEVRDDYSVLMSGSVTRVADVEYFEEMLRWGQ